MQNLPPIQPKVLYKTNLLRQLFHLSKFASQHYYNYTKSLSKVITLATTSFALSNIDSTSATSFGE